MLVAISYTNNANANNKENKRKKVVIRGKGCRRSAVEVEVKSYVDSTPVINRQISKFTEFMKDFVSIINIIRSLEQLGVK